MPEPKMSAAEKATTYASAGTSHKLPWYRRRKFWLLVIVPTLGAVGAWFGWEHVEPILRSIVENVPFLGLLNSGGPPAV